VKILNEKQQFLHIMV